MVINKPLKISVLVILFIALVAAALIYNKFSSSLPMLDGDVVSAELGGKVTLHRDQQGIPTILAESRADTAFALGFVHAQERLFQMDLLRKNSAGELSELFGDVASEFDSKMRIHQFRKRANLAVDNLPQAHKDILSAYTKGVNAGVNKLTAKPFEYYVLQVDPSPWQYADSALVLISMYIDLQPEWSESERSLAVMKDLLPADWFDFLTSQGGYWDAPTHGDALVENKNIPLTPLAQFSIENAKEEVASNYQFMDQIHYGSNNWSVSGALTKHKSGMVADDMHLKLRVPNIWYRASWYLEDGRRVTGASLPGTPAIVVGSNENIAWGFTNSQGDYHDVIVLKTNEEKTQYLSKDGYQDIIIENEVVKVKAQDDISVEVKLTQWGPIIGENQKGELLAMRWVTHDPDGVNFRLLDLETTNTVNEALIVGAESGVPGQNLNVVDKEGNQAWTIMGRLPKRFGFETGLGENFNGSQFPQDWSTGDKGWDGFLDASDYPKVVNPESGRIWTANARIVSGELLKKVGVSNYALGARQKQIRDDMLAIESFTPQDFLDIQLDDKAVFLTRWHQLLLSLVSQDDSAEQYKEVIEVLNGWEGRASATSAGYLLVKRFREGVVDQTAGEIYRHLKNNSNEFWPSSIDNFVEYPVWQLVTEQPIQHIPKGHESWNAFLLTRLDATIETLTADGGELKDQLWGSANTLAIKHPLSKAIPALGWLLDMPAEGMDGDTYMPRVQKPSSGASQRYAVSPGHEDEGFFHMATGQSGHPLSPYYDAGHRDWVEGKPSAFLPGPKKWTLNFSPHE